MTDLSRRSFAKYVSCLAPALASLPTLTHAQADGSCRPHRRRLPARRHAGPDRQAPRRRHGRRRTALCRRQPAGAAGRIANAQLKRERADGSVVLCTHTSAMTIYPHVYANLSYDPAKDVRPVASLASATCVLAISTALPAEIKTLADYVRWLKANDTGRTYASPAAGSLAQFLGYRFSQAAGVPLTHVALSRLRAGDAGPARRTGPGLPRIRRRFPAVPRQRQGPSSGRDGRAAFEVPQGRSHFAEQGFGTVVGRGKLRRLRAGFDARSDGGGAGRGDPGGSRDKALVGGLEQIGLEAAYLGSAEYAQLITTERERWKPVVAASGFKADE